MSQLETSQQLCRICSNTRNDAVSLDHTVDGKSIVEMLRCCVKLECCQECKGDLIVAYKLVVRCLDAETWFRKQLNVGVLSLRHFEQIDVKTEDFLSIKSEDDRTVDEIVSKSKAKSTEEPRVKHEENSLLNRDEDRLSEHSKEDESIQQNDDDDDNKESNHCEENDGDRFKDKAMESKRRKYVRINTSIPKRCCKCKTRLQSMDQAMKHSKTHLESRIVDPQKNKARPFECPICFRRYTKKRALLLHQREMYIEKSFNCQECDEDFLTETQLHDHTESHSKNKTGRKGQLPKCCACYAQFESDELMIKHAIDVHLPESQMATNDNENQFACDVCFRRYKTKRVLLDHKSKPYRTKQYQCSQCGRIFRDKCALSDHERCHQGEQQFVCPVCFKPFAIKDSFRKHVRSHTIEEDRFKCEICNKGFKTKGNLKDHHITHASDYRPLNCSLCSATFARKSCLKSHMRMHTGEKPFKCEMCDASYAFSSDLKRHIMAHKGIKPHICNVCGRGYPRQDYLRKHISSHYATN
ncbi:zinc finger protein 26-like isoform X2 [Topomyia yanbarensis]|uniref:zinc finger protein 26-like isoform X2 n=1 Tax=Topomyia yanbarensis TaxID=2498891 RepID=UPI00273BA810|nr:zinc finger protein 26-like isoform X2 [Topomyia yanbarensis]